MHADDGQVHKFGDFNLRSVRELQRTANWTCEKGNAVERRMQTFIGFLRDLGWGVTIGIVVLLMGGAFFYFEHRGTTKNRKLNGARETPRVRRPFSRR